MLSVILRFLAFCIVLATAAFGADAALAFPGDLDPTFGSGGVVDDPTLPPGRSVALQADGKIVIVHDANRLSRFDPHGALDPTFGTGGVVMTPFPGYAVAARPDGTILVAGGESGTFAVARYDATGTLDPLFGSGGVATITLATNGEARSLVVQSTGAIVLAGTTVDPHTQRKAVLARFTSAGVLDASFGAAGIVAAPDYGSDQFVNLKLASADALILVGTIGNAIAIRFDSEGRLDEAFGNGGTVRNDEMAALDAAVQPDDAIVIVGYIELSVAVVRVTASGAFDPTFGTKGIAVYGGLSFANSVVLEPSGDVVVAGDIVHTVPGEAQGDFAVFRYTPNGFFDQDFGAGGIADTELGADEAIVASALDGDTLIVAGVTQSIPSSTDPHFVLARYRVGDLCRVMPSCKTTAPHTSTLELRADPDAERDRFRWKYRKGEATTLAELDDPRTADRYALCVFDESGAEPIATAGVALPPGPTCDASPCWSAFGRKGFRYRGDPSSAEGIDSIKLTSGDAGKSSITVEGRGAALAPANLPRHLPLRVQLQASNGTCWQSRFSSAGVVRNDAVQFKAKSD